MAIRLDGCTCFSYPKVVDAECPVHHDEILEPLPVPYWARHDDRWQAGYCMICRPKLPVPVQFLPIYVIGSEGLTVCHDCTMKITDYVRGMMDEVLEQMKQDFLAKRAQRKD